MRWIFSLLVELKANFKVNTKQVGLGYQQWQGVRHVDFGYFLSLRDEIAKQSVPVAKDIYIENNSSIIF